jgi:MoxR-like ATPase
MIQPETQTSDLMSPSEFIDVARSIEREVAKVIVGQEEVVRGILTCLLAGGHALLEGVPGLGKTMLVRTLAQALDLSFSRIQFTPDLMPADITGTNIIADEGGARSFQFQSGPVFANIVLADEINRTTPRTQSALLEAMAEETISVENQTYPLQRPFMVVATQNPFEFEGTYYLPENQLDRFLLRISVGYPDRASEHRILSLQPGRTRLEDLKPVTTAAEVVAMQDRVPQTRLDATILDYIIDLAEATRNHEQLHLGISPRGSLALTAAAQASAVLNGRDYVIPDDVKQLVIPVCAHRVISKSYLHNGDADSTGRILRTILDQVPTPR